MAKRIERKLGDVVGEYDVVYIRETEKRHRLRRAAFRCSCGNVFETYISAVAKNKTKSCGCRNHIPTYGNLKHGLNDSRLYKKWQGIKRRCYNENEQNYPIYGGSGIRVCDKWLNNPEAFVNYCKTLNGCDDASLTIDRIRSGEDYKPGNIRFTTYTVQARNTRVNKNNTSGYSGVSKIGNRFFAFIGIDYKSVNLGRYNTPKEAATARDKYIIDNNLEGFNLQVL